MEKLKRVKSYHKAALFDEMQAKVAEIRNRLPGFKSLTPEQLNWKPNKKAWSVGQCFDHMNLFMDHYLTRQLKPKLTLAHTELKDEDLTTGKAAQAYILISHPDYHKRARTIKAMRPAKESNANEITFKYLDAHLASIDELLQHYQNININSYTIGGHGNEMMVRIKFGSALYMAINHTLKHFNQAQKVMNEPGFPGN